MAFHVVFSLIIYTILLIYYKNERKIRFSLHFEVGTWLIFSILFFVLYGLYVNYLFFRPFPRYIPSTARPQLEIEHSIAASIMTGINKKRTTFLTYQDPMCFNQTLKMSPLPVTYIACLSSLNGNFVDISILIGTLNTISTTIALYTLLSYYSGYSFFAILCVLLNGSWFFVRYLYTPNPNVDLIHDIDRGFNIPFYQIFYTFIISSKTSSFVFPMAVFALAFTTVQRFGSYRLYLISGILAALCPSFMTSAALFISLACNFHSIFATIPFVISLLWKYAYSHFTFQTLWYEYQLNGYFFSQILSWVDMFGPFIIVLFTYFFLIRNPQLIHKMISLIGPICFISFFRNGGDTYDNALAAASVVYPMVVTCFMRCFQILEMKIKNKKIKGILYAIFYSIIIMCALGGHLSCYRQVIRCNPGVDEDDQIVGRWIVQHVPIKETIFMIQMPMNPVSFSTGYRVFSGMPQDLWARGENYAGMTNALRSIDIMNGCPNLMRSLNLTYFVENLQVPLVIRNPDLLKQYRILAQNTKWSLMELIPEEYLI